MWFKPKEFVKNKKFSISKNYFEYANFDNINDIINLVKDSKDNYNELICKNDLVKPYFDIESTTQFDINSIINTIKKIFNELYNVILSNSDIFILECNRMGKEEFKWSYHVIIDGYHFLDKTQAKFCAMDLNDYHSEVDLSVYSDGYQNIRMLNCVKKGETVPFKLIGREYTDEIFDKSLITNITEESICIEFTFEDTNIEIISEKEFLSIVPLIEKDLGTKIENIKECKNYITFNYDHNYKCLFGEKHSQLAHCVNKIENGVFSVTCFSSKCKGKKIYNNNCSILKELDKFSEHSEAKDYNIKHYELIKNTNKMITAAIQSNLKPIHNFISKCKNANLYSECTKDGYRVSCKNCDFKFPPENSIPLDKVLTPQIFNILINNVQEDINNKDTSQVAKQILNYINLIYTDKKWYLYNKESGIYEIKDELEIQAMMETIVEQMKDEDLENDWYNWIDKVNYKDNLLRELRIKCYKRIDLDSNEFLLGFENGVLDLNTNTFRKGSIDEYVTMKCGIKYNENIDSELGLKFMSDIFPDKEECEYSINKLTLCLEGFNREQMITFSYGFSASNGKSYLMERIKQIMGDYAGTFPVTLLTNKMKGAGEANSSLVNFNKKRFMYCSEPEANSKLNTNFVKVLTGDKITARAVYAEKEIEIYPSYKIFICCNMLPNFDTYDEGIARRIAITEYKTKFCETPSKKKKNEKQIRKYSRQEEYEISGSLLKLLIDRYRLLKNNNFVYDIPKELQEMKKLYLNDNKDIIKNILNDNFEIGTSSDYVKMTDIRRLLKNTNELKDKDIVSLIYIIQDTFNDAEFKKHSTINNVSTRNFFIKLKIKD